MSQPDVAEAIRAALLDSVPASKVMATRKLARDWRCGRLQPVFGVTMPDESARPEAPLLLAPKLMPRRGPGTVAGRIALWHALAHIEFVAIDLALDMAGRFGGEMGSEFTGDFLAIAADEALHFVMLNRRLRELGSHYGALPAHDGLWDAARETRHDVAARLAVVPMVLEARGLDVTPAAIAKLEAAGDHRGVQILKRILDDEVRHVGIGTKHFAILSQNRTLEADEWWKSLVRQYFRGKLKPPFNDSARASAGLSRDCYRALAL